MSFNLKKCAIKFSCWLSLVYASHLWSHATNDLITEKKLRSHVAYLCSDALAGRMTGTAGERKAAEYIAQFFFKLGLEPAGDKGSFLQAFDIISKTYSPKNNRLSLASHRYKLDKEWRLLSFSSSQAFTTSKLIFAGFGIAAPQYNSYKNLNVTNKWVIVFAGMPASFSTHELGRYASLRHKAFAAKQQGALGIIFIAQRPDELIPFNGENDQSKAGIIALSVTQELLNQWLTKAAYPITSVEKLQQHFATSAPSPLPPLTTIPLRGQTTIEHKVRQGYNVLAKLRLTPKKQPLVIVGAHYDHLGLGNLNNFVTNKGRIYPGADDNASGVATVLEVAARLTKEKQQGKLKGNKDLLFAAWSGEEIGVLGSSHFVNNLEQAKGTKSLHDLIDVVINLDMVGHLRKKLVLQGTGSSADWPALLQQIQKQNSLPFISQKDPYLPTDSTSFFIHKIPTLNLFTGAHAAYHRPQDTATSLNYKGITQITNLLTDLILTIEQKPNPFIFQNIAQEQGRQKQALKIYLGTIPNYASADIKGVKLSGVTANSPAEKAGLKAKDIIIQLAGKPIDDIYDYTYVLNSLKVNQVVSIVVLRQLQKIELKISAQYRNA